MRGFSLAPAQVADLIGTSTDTLRTWSNRKIGGQAIFEPNMLGMIPGRAAEKRTGKWRRYTIGDIYVGAVITTLGDLFIPAAEARSMAGEMGLSMLLVSTKYPGAEELPAKVAVWPYREGWHVRPLESWAAFSKIEDAWNSSIPYCLPTGLQVPGHRGAYTVIDLAYIAERVDTRAKQAGLYDGLLTAQADLLKEIYELLEASDVVQMMLSYKKKQSALAEIIVNVLGIKLMSPE